MAKRLACWLVVQDVDDFLTNYDVKVDIFWGVGEWVGEYPNIMFEIYSTVSKGIK